MVFGLGSGDNELEVAINADASGFGNTVDGVIGQLGGLRGAAVAASGALAALGAGGCGFLVVSGRPMVRAVAVGGSVVSYMPS